MLEFFPVIAKVLLASGVIVFSSWLAQKRPGLAGFIIALPISSMLALAFHNKQFGDTGKSVVFAKSILSAIPLSLLFFVPFLLVERLRWGFWPLYCAGVVLIGCGYGIQRLIFPN